MNVTQSLNKKIFYTHTSLWLLKVVGYSLEINILK